MKTIGLIGGMSWESTVTYYQTINVGIKARLGGLHSAKLIMISLDFAEVEAMQQQGDWFAAADMLIQAAKRLEVAGADGFIICTNTMHKLVGEIESQVSIPLLHIADATAEILKQKRVSKVGLLGTAFTMEHDFYKGRLTHHGLEVITPNSVQRNLVHEVIYQELCKGKINPASKQAYLEIVDSLVESGVDAVILGCTEIGLLIQQADTAIPLVDTTTIHAEAAVEFMLS